MTNNYLCIHGHFYQPPRENPWLEFIERQDSAHPFHDWNERITRECYGPNARARLLGDEGRIQRLINNYETMSFNFGPTLLAWLERAHPWIYRKILSADHAGRARYGGHGNALAQVYNHVIMPLASPRDKLTQIRWGLTDFEHRFGRPAEGMWLAETAVDKETLTLMAQEGVRFTILSPDQAKRVRPLDANDTAEWEDVAGGRIDPSRAYRVRLDASGASYIDVFFYHGPISRATAYENLMASGEGYLARIQEAFPNHRDGARLVSVATDGESYGHHSTFGEMALAWLFQHLAESNDIELINYGLFLERFPPEYEVELVENSSWSCAHGVERWRSDCGCHVGHEPGWNQAWRRPLREGLEWLATELQAVFNERGGTLFKDPWAARDDYVRVLLQPTPEERERFLARQVARPLVSEEKVEALELMESQRMAMYMFTSCGWFFDDIAGLEATQVLKYAARAIDLVRPRIEKDLEAGLLDFLATAKSNDPRYRHGSEVYESLVKPARIDAAGLAAHYGLTSLISQAEEPADLLKGKVKPLRQRRFIGEDRYVLVGEAEIIEPMTGVTSIETFAAIKRDNQGLSCTVGERLAERDFDESASEIFAALSEGASEFGAEELARHLRSAQSYRIEDLIPDARHLILCGLAEHVDQETKRAMESHYNTLEEVLDLCRTTGERIPESLDDLLRLRLSNELEALLSDGPEVETIDWPALERLLHRAIDVGLPLRESTAFKERLQRVLAYQLQRITTKPEWGELKEMTEFLRLVHQSDLGLDLWGSQNIYFDKDQDPEFIGSLSADVVGAFRALGRELGFAIEIDEQAGGASHEG
jgi:alpha-amylase/alpha-mannosidase (GH57 family)